MIVTFSIATIWVWTSEVHAASVNNSNVRIVPAAAALRTLSSTV